MKNTIIVFALVATCSFANAAQTINVSNVNGNVVNSILDNTGAPVGDGVFTFEYGVFEGGLTPESVDLSTLAFTQVGAAPTQSFTTAGAFGAAGSPGAFRFDGFDGDVSSVDGSPISILAYDGGSRAEATQAYLFTTNVVFAETAPPTITSFTLDGTNGNLVFGAGPLQAAALVPEPSAALLAGLALVGGLVRRRR